ncbi:hypothetical protein D3P07_03120 [Paenibacillus sp. 1011MAR3C5]|uniref:hypothetical protein n=1 Tax=Paenibacillus sp. 1011MAR3C5 TaxID=1675787 RepID=UPI000E6C7E33|nr:hypothetical protein [Paenibacillus sp. 1011MAR3C5]RJE91076.1 hypothetical protein D3P07_03120 [Paenibacillus sp. 1011MAR3C5]
MTGARVRGIVNRGGEPCAEVEVDTDSESAPVVLAYFANEGGKAVLRTVLSNDAERETDWFDNNLHQAFEDITAEASYADNEKGRHSFQESVLAAAHIRQEVEATLADTL